MSPCLSPRRRQQQLPVREGFLCWPRLCGAVAHRREFLVVTGPADRDDRQLPGVQQPLQLAVTGRIMRGVHGGVVLAEELGAFLPGQVPENDRRVIRVLNLGRLCGHAIQATPRPGQNSALAAGPGYRGSPRQSVADGVCRVDANMARTREQLTVSAGPGPPALPGALTIVATIL